MRKIVSPLFGIRSPFGWRGGFWILITGLWADTGIWVDARTWKDGV